jgi:membrane protein required for colicin V production
MIIDLVICAIILISALVAFFRGFIREVLTILGVVGGLMAAYTFGASLVPFYNDLMNVEPVAEGESAERFMGMIPYPLLSEILGYTTIFLLVVIVLGIISYFLSKFVEEVGMGMMDRTLGVIFGIARGVVLLGVIYLPIQIFVGDDEKKDWFEGSRLHIYVEWTADWLEGFLPEGFVEETAQDQVDQTRETLKKLEILPEAEDKMSTEDGAQRPVSEPDSGYDGPQRKSMEDLIQEQEQAPTFQTPGAGND